MTEEVNTPMEEVQKVKLSELIEERKQLDEKSQEMLSQVQKDEYSISFGTKKVFTECIKYLEKNSPWNAYTAAGLIMLYNNMIEQKNVVRQMENDGKEWDGIVKLRTANITILWKMLTQMTGTGFHEAKDFVTVMAKIGEDVTKAVQAIDKKNAEIRDINTKIEQLNTRIDNPGEDVELDVNPEDVEQTTMEALKEEVDPQV